MVSDREATGARPAPAVKQTLGAPPGDEHGEGNAHDARASLERHGSEAESLIVCLSESPHSAQLLLRAQRMAGIRRLRWLAVYVETPRYFRLPLADRERLAQTLRLAEHLGAEVVRLPGDDVAEAVVEFARARRASGLVVGKPPSSRRRLLSRRSVFQDIVDLSGPLDVYVVTGDEEAPPRPRQVGGGPRRPQVRHYLVSTGIIAVVAVLVWLLKAYFPVPNLSILFLTAVLASAVQWGLGVSIYAAIVSIILYDFFFVDPPVALTAPRPQDILSLVEFLAVAAITSNLTAQVRAQVEAAKRRETRTAALYALSQQLAQAGGLEGVLDAVVVQVSSILNARAVLLLAEGGQLAVRAASPGATLEAHEQAAAAAIWREDEAAAAVAAAGTAEGALERVRAFADTSWLFLPLKTAHATVGVLGVAFPPASGSLFDERRLLEALAGQAAVAIERANLVQDMAQARLLAETDRLRTALLSSISHDLRTPLASIIGAASSLLNYGATYDDTVHQAMLETVQEEAERLDRFVANLLNMTRLESGALRLKRGVAEPKDLIGSTLTRLAARLEQRNVLIDVDADCPVVNVDFVLVEQVLFNVLDNAIKYSAPGSSIQVKAQNGGDKVLFVIADEGIGVAEADLERIFDKFYRVNEGDAHGAGTGLGLSICRGIVDAHGGRIWAERRQDAPGLAVRIELPAAEAANDSEALIQEVAHG